MTGKLVFLDIDGTLMNGRQQVPDSAQDACRRAVDNGHTLLLSSGRSKPEVYPWLFDLGFAGLVGGGGSFAELGDTVLFEHLLGEGDVREVSDYFDMHGIDYIWQSSTSLYATDRFVHRFEQHADAPVGQSSDWSPLADIIRRASAGGPPRRASKSTFVCPAGGDVRFVDVREAYRGRFDIVLGSVDVLGPENGELMIRGVNKGSALLEIAQLLKVPVEDTVAIGDSDNDFEMIQLSGVGVAMGNGRENVRAAADLVTDDIDSDGLAHAFERLGLV